MKIVDRKTFMAMPAGTIFQKYEPCNFGRLQIKDGPIDDVDFYTVCGVEEPHFEGMTDSGMWFQHCEEIAAGQPSAAIDFDVISRDGLFEHDQLFAVWEKADVAGLVARFQQAFVDGYQGL